ncbi:MAG: B12-binding domain-containing radical SAM protein [Exilispira sp.]
MTGIKKKFDEIWIEENLRNLKFSKNVALVYPEQFKVGSSNLGFHILIKNLISIGHKPVRFFYDRANQEFFSYDTDKKINDFQYIFITISYENDLDNLKKGFKSSFKHFPASNNKIIIGGAAVNLSPFLFYDFATEFGIGESEEYFNKSFNIEELDFLKSELIKDHFNNDLFDNKSIIEKKKILNNKLLEFKSYYYRVSNTKIPAYSIFISKYSSFPNYFLIELSRGCPFKCHFCNLGFLYENYKLFDLDQIINKLMYAYKFTKNFGLISAVVPPYKYIEEIRKAFPDATLHLSSLRLDSISDNFLNIISQMKLKTVTIAPETAIEKLRFSIGKRFTNNEIIEFILLAMNKGISRFKFYFILGLKSMYFEYNYEKRMEELICEADALILLIDKIQNHTKQKLNKLPKISISINPLIPKPLTELSLYNFIDLELYKKIKIYLCKEIYKRKNINIEFISYNEAKREYQLSWNNLFEI